MSRYLLRRNEPGARVLPVVSTPQGPALCCDFYEPLPEPDDLTDAEAAEVEELLRFGDYVRVTA